MPGFAGLLESLLGATWFDQRSPGMQGLIQRRTNSLTLEALMRLASDPNASSEVRAQATGAIEAIDSWLSARTLREQDVEWKSAYVDARLLIQRYRDNPAIADGFGQVQVPPGSPIGDDYF